MAIAALPQQEEMELFEVPWPKPTLRLVAAGERTVERTVGRGNANSERDVVVELRRGPSAAVRRRRTLLAVAALVLLVLLALPIQALGGMTATGKVAPGGVVSGLVDGTTYVVQPGDTVASVARALNPAGDQAVLQAKIRSIVGSSVLVPGEHILLP
jgi:hypothetical protein